MKICCSDSEFLQLLKDNPGSSYAVHRNHEGQIEGDIFKRSALWIGVQRAVLNEVTNELSP